MSDDRREHPSGLVHHDEVGVSLMAGAEADAIVEVVLQDLGDAARVSRRASYVRLETDAGRLEIRYAEVEEVLGYTFGAGEFQAVLSAYYGRPSLEDDRIEFHANVTAGVLHDPPGTAAAESTVTGAA